MKKPKLLLIFFGTLLLFLFLMRLMNGLNQKEKTNVENVELIEKEIHPKDLLHEAEVMVSQKDYLSAIATLEGIIGLYPETPEAIESKILLESARRDGEAQIKAKQKEEEALLARIEEFKKREEAERLASELAWDRSRAGKIQKKYPQWTREECKKVADRKIWIGMKLEMLKYNRGRPDHASPSNYGYGTEWQWCWDDYTPSCFYGKDDGIITSYN